MRNTMVLALVCATAVRAAEPLPQEMYDLRAPELTVARSLTDTMRTARVLGAPVMTPRKDRPMAVVARHVGSDALPARAPVTLARHGLASAQVGVCARCGAPVAESYAVLCEGCRGR